MKRILIATIIAIVCIGCVDRDNATRVLASNGYKNIVITGYNFYSCSEDDFYHTGFTAISPNGTFIEGTVCSGFLFKGSTIRFD